VSAVLSDEWKTRHRRLIFEVFRRRAADRCISERSACRGIAGPQTRGAGFRRMEEIDRHREVSGRAAVVPVSCLTREFCELQKLSDDSLLASRPSHRPPPMMTNHSHDRVLPLTSGRLR
jgi:hypothetical protein